MPADSDQTPDQLPLPIMHHATDWGESRGSGMVDPGVADIPDAFFSDAEQ